MDTKTELTEEEIQLCLYLKKQGVLNYSAGNAILSFNGDGSEVTVKFEKFTSERFKRKP